jgi:type 1 glutamine amidotransferase
MKTVFIAGVKSHGPGDHEYEQDLRLLAECLRTSPDVARCETQVCLYGWPEDPATLDTADAIVIHCDGSDHREADHPLLVGDRLETLRRQARRGAGLVLLHYSTFVPASRGASDLLDWVGGFFDYETGGPPNGWRSAIDWADAQVKIASPEHEISRGVESFSLKDEFYHHMRFLEPDPRRIPILQIDLPGAPGNPETVAWAVEREDGGRGFVFTGGHSHANLQMESLRRTLLNAIVWTARGAVPAGGVRSTVRADQDAIRTLILTGYEAPAHDWQADTEALKIVLGDDARVRITVWEDPERLATEDLGAFDVVVQNYCNWDRPSLSGEGRSRLLEFVREGGGLAIVHFANGAWSDWPEYFGGLARRVWIDDKSSHDAYGSFRVRIVDPDHRLTAGLQDFDTVDELYCNQQGELPVDPLLTARSVITGRDEPMAFVYPEGRGRIFQTLLGHDAQAIRTPAHAELIRRAVAWTANREIHPQLAPDAG